MHPLPLPLPTLLLLLPALTTATCPTCTTYASALKTCQTTTANLTAIGATTDTTSVHCMCVSHSSSTQMNTCQGCATTDYDGEFDVDIQVLLAWYETCTARDQWGDGQGVRCWEGQPGDYLPCVSQTGGKGGRLGGGDGDGAATTLGSSPTSTGSASTGTPSAKAKSDSTTSLVPIMLSSIMFVALGVLVGL